MLKQALELNKNKIWKIKTVEDVKKLLQHNASSPHLSLIDSSSHLHSPQSLPFFFLPNPPPCIVSNFDQDLWPPGLTKCSLNDKAHNWLLGNAPMPWAKATQSSGIQTQCCSPSLHQEEAPEGTEGVGWISGNSLLLCQAGCRFFSKMKQVQQVNFSA